MNLEETARLTQPLRELLASGSRVNELKPQRYWYPLSIATYDLEEVLSAVDSMCSFRTSMWEKTQEFEESFSAATDAGHSIMVNSGSSADLLIAFALVNPAYGGLAAGDEVLVPAVTWPTHVWSLIAAGLRPVLVDVDPYSLNIDLDNAERHIGERTKALSLVHLLGNPVDMDRAREMCRTRDLLLVEDCCEALGSRWRDRQVGSFGLAASFSFFFSHHITTMEGGMVCCSSDELADLFRLLRAHGWTRDVTSASHETDDFEARYRFVNIGFNLRPTEIQAAFGIEQLKRLPSFQETRSQNVQIFQKLIDRFDHLEMPRVHADGEPSWFALPLMVGDEAPFERAALVRHLEQEGIETRPIVAGSMARQPAARLFGDLRSEDLAGADKVHERGFYIGLHPVDMNAHFDRLGEILDAFYGATT